MQIVKFIKSDRFEKLIHWAFSFICLMLAIIHLALAVWVEYPGVLTAVAFTAAAIIFCPLVKAPNWIKFLVGLALAIAT